MIKDYSNLNLETKHSWEAISAALMMFGALSLLFVL